MNIAVFGAMGRVGSKVIEIAQQRGHTVLPIDVKLDKSGENSGKIAQNLTYIDAVIDFSVADATKQVCEFCEAHHCALITGVTGRNAEQQALIDELCSSVQVIAKANFSVGISMLQKLCEIVARELTDWDCEIVETHRKGKLDAPSGTAKALATTVAKQRNFRRVTTHALRLGSNYGQHQVIFATNGESLTLTHQAENVDIFALGAVLSAERLTQ